MADNIGALDYANDLANDYPVTMDEALEYITIDVNSAETACKMRTFGIDHNDVLWAIRAGFDNMHQFAGERYKNLVTIYNRIAGVKTSHFIERYGRWNQPVLDEVGKMSAYCGHEGQTHEELAIDWILHNLTQAGGSVEDAKILAEYVLEKRGLK